MVKIQRSWHSNRVAQFFFSLSLVLLFLMISCLTISAQVDLQITEIYNGQEGEDLTVDWFEITNVGNAPWINGLNPDLYYDDESASAADADIILAITDIQPDESVIVLITDDPMEIPVFVGVWGPVIDLTNVKIGFSDGAGLSGGGDAVTLWLGDPSSTNPVDSEAYPDASNNDGQTYDVDLAAFSMVGNANGAVQTIALGGDNMDTPNIGSPGNGGATGVDPGAPVVMGNQMLAGYFHNVPDIGPAIISVDLNDPTDKILNDGIPLIIEDADNSLSEVTATVFSDNFDVLPVGNFNLSGPISNPILSIDPVQAGYVNILVVATDTAGNQGNYLVFLAVSDATIDPASTRFHAGASDGSTAIAVDNDFMWVADDENQTLRLFNRDTSGLPAYSMNFNNDLGSDEEVDIEGSFRVNDTIYWMGSHTNQDRSVIFKTIETGSGQNATLAYGGKYEDLRDDLIAWDDNDEHGFGSGFFGFSVSFEIEGLAADPNNPDGALLAFRGPLVNGDALLLPVTNYQTIVSNNPVPNSAAFGTPILLDLQGHSIRSIECNDDGCLIVGGPFATTNDFRLYTWTGNSADSPELRAADLTAQANMSAFEGIVELPSGPFLGSDGDNIEVTLLIDCGTFDYYGDGTEAKDLPNDEWKKFRTEKVTLGTVEIPPVANPGDIVISEILQNPAAVTDADGEWLELFNTTLGDIDINGWIIADNGSDTIIIDNGGPLVIEAGAYLVIGANSDTMLNGGVMVDYAYDSGFTLANGADEVILIASDSTEIDRVEYDGGPDFPDPEGASMALQATNFDNNDGANWCEAVTAYGDGDLGTPGAPNDCPAPAAPDLQITEMWVGQDGDDLTEDWFEITNFGDEAWISGVNEDLFYDDDSQDPISADPINGINDIQPGESVIVMIGVAADADSFFDVWSPDYDLTGIEIGWTDGSGLSQGGDGVTLFLGGPSVMNIVDFESYPPPASGVSYDVVLEAFSMEGAGIDTLGTNIAVATTATAGSDGMEPAIGSPGNQGPIVTPAAELVITEIFPGQSGDDLTEDWFEIRNIGNAPWVAGVDSTLFYDDESADPADAVPVQGIETILPGATAVILLTDTPADTLTFIDIWSPVIDLTGVEIGFADGSGLGGGGDAVTLWAGDPNTTMPIDMAAYPDTDLFDGQSYDVDLQEFSVVGNANGAVETLAQGGDNMEVPNIGSPGDGLAIAPFTGLVITEIFSGQQGDDLTEDWFEIKNTGNTAWVSGVDPALFYDDESMSAADADTIFGIASIEPGATAIVVITDNPAADTTSFINIWSEVIDLSGVEIGYTDGAGLSGNGDAVTLWLGDPTMVSFIDTASYPATNAFDGQSWDVELDTFSVVGNANGAVQTIATAGSSGDVPNIGSPGDGLAIPPQTGLKITEMFPGQAGDDLTEDWFEIENTGTTTWVSGVDPDLYYDDESADPVDAVIIQGIDSIQPGATAIVLLTDAPADTLTFIDIWSEVIDLTGVEIGFADGSGLGGGGDAVTLWLGDPNAVLPIDTASYPETDAFDGQSWDVLLGEFSVVGNANGAVQTLALGGDNMDTPNIGSPGNGFAIPPVSGLKITEVFPGQQGEDLTVDWFEIRNTDTTAWISGIDPDLYYDDESADPSDAVIITGIDTIQPGERVIVLITDLADDTTTFIDVWSPVIDLSNVQIGLTDGSGLSGDGDAVALWLGNPNDFLPIDIATYPETSLFDGQSFDSDLNTFSVVGNANGAVQTIALGGDNMDVPNIGSPGDGLAIPQVTGLEITEIFAGQEGEDLTADWIEIKNTGTTAWVSGVDPDLFYDDESADPADAVLIQGITDIQPDETVIVLITDDPAADTTQFVDVWSPVIILDGIEIGFTDGAGLSGDGDAATLWLGDPTNVLPLDIASYPDTESFDGQSYDSDLDEFSVVGNANGAVQTIALGGDNMDVPNIGSPGNLGPVVNTEHLPTNASILVYPNPTQDWITIEFGNGDAIEMIQIVDLAGKVVYAREVDTFGTLQINLSDLPASVYYLQVRGVHGIATEKIVKQ